MNNENTQFIETVKNIVPANTKSFREGFIYRIVNNINGKCYIGQTIGTVEHRFRRHIYNANAKNEECKALEAAIRKYGVENFIVETILVCNEFELDDYEIAMIKQYDSLVDGYGYNLREGGDGRMTKESIERMIEGNIVKTQAKNTRTGDELPKYVIKHYEVNIHGSTIEGYRVSDHPNGANKSFTNRRKYSMDELKTQAIEYANMLTNSPIYVVNKNAKNKFIWTVKKVQFLVQKPGFPQKIFNEGNKDKNRADAEAYLSSLIN